jgi:hypothetical protein
LSGHDSKAKKNLSRPTSLTAHNAKARCRLLDWTIHKYRRKGASEP